MEPGLPVALEVQPSWPEERHVWRTGVGEITISEIKNVFARDVLSKSKQARPEARSLGVDSAYAAGLLHEYYVLGNVCDSDSDVFAEPMTSQVTHREVMPGKF